MKSLRIARNLKFQKSDGLVKISQFLSKTGEWALSRDIVDEAIRDAQANAQPQLRAAALGESLEALGDSREEARAVKIAKEGVAAAKMDRSAPNIRFRTILNIGWHAARAGYPQVADAAYLEAETEVWRCQLTERDTLFWELAVKFAETGNADLSLAAASKIAEDKNRSGAFVQIANKSAAKGLLRAARMAADSCVDSQDRLNAYAAVLSRGHL